MRKTLFVFLFLGLCLSMQAGVIPQEQARLNVLAFLSQKHSTLAKGVRSFTRKTVKPQSALPGDSLLYVFNVDGGGFVIASGDDAVAPILGYCFEGTFDLANAPEGLKEMFMLYKQEMAAARSHNLVYKEKASLHAAVDYLVQATWNQSAPYNNQCPLDGSNRSITGCVATAMAQVMYYTHYPTAACTAIPAYTTSTKKIVMPQLDATTFDWSVMKNNYAANETGTSVDEMAKLMLYCGQSMKMNYSAAVSSSSGNVAPAFINYFGYDWDCRYVERSNFTDVDWDNMVYGEIAAGRPVIYGAGGLGAIGHAFVVDGYDGSGNYHLNWGWSGSCNGYFKLSALTPGLINGGTPSSDGYNIYPAAVVGIQAPTPYTGTVGLEVTQLKATNTTVTKTDVSNLFQGLTYQFSCTNPTKSTYQFQTILSLYDASGNYLSEFDSRDYFTQTLTPRGVYSAGPMEQYYGGGMAAGTYQVRADYKIYDEATSTWSEWRPCINNDKYYIVLTVSEDRLTATYSNVAPATVTRTAGYTINTVTFGTDPMTTFPTTCTLNITNTGTAYYSVINMYETTNVTDSLMSSIGVFIDPGETDNVVLHFKPANSGDAVPYVFTGTGFTTTTVTTKINRIPDTNIAVEGIFGNYEYWDNSTLRYKGNLMIVHANYTNNNASDAFTQGVYVQLTGLSALAEGNIETVAETRTLAQRVNVAAGQSGTATFVFEGLNYDYIYRVTLGYLDYHNYLIEKQHKAGSYFHLTPQPFTIQHINYTTYCNARAWRVPQGVTAYIATGTQTEGETKSLTFESYAAGTVIPAGMGVLLKGPQASYNFDFEPDDSVTINPATNYFVGTTETVTPETESNYKYYRLSAQDVNNDGVYDENVGFYYGAENGAAFSVAANKAYLRLPASLGSKVSGFVFDKDGTLTSVTQPLNDAQWKEGAVYDMTGRKVASSLQGLTKGLYICNGKKIIIK